MNYDFIDLSSLIEKTTKTIYIKIIAILFMTNKLVFAKYNLLIDLSLLSQISFFILFIDNISIKLILFVNFLYLRFLLEGTFNRFYI